MRPISILVLVVATALMAGLWVFGFPDGGSTPGDWSIPNDFSGIAESLNTAITRFLTWLPDIYQRFPAVVIGLAGLVVLPLLALLGLLVRSIQQMRLTRRLSRKAHAASTMQQSPQMHYQGPAWIKILTPCKRQENSAAGAAKRTKVVLRGEMLRIGRERDNDVCLDDPSVHRYHALIQRTPDDEFVIADLSGHDGNGLWVNGSRLQNGALSNGDDIRLGKMRLLFGIGDSERNAA